MNGMTMGLRIPSWYLSICIQIALDKMQLCLLSVAYACPYHNPNATMGNSVHNVDISKSLAHTMSYTLSSIWPAQLNWDSSVKSTYPVFQWPSKLSICPLKLAMTPNCSQVKTLVRTTSTQMSFPETFWQFVLKFFCCANPVSSAVQMAGLRRSRRWRSWMWRSRAGVVTCGLWLWGRLDRLQNSLKRRLRQLMDIKLYGNSFGGYSCSQNDNWTLPQNLRHQWHCVVWQNCRY